MILHCKICGVALQRSVEVFRWEQLIIPLLETLSASNYLDNQDCAAAIFNDKR